MKYFGTDGIRGISFVDLSHKICFGCGNALNKLTKNPTVIVGRDTRLTGEFFSLSCSLGVMAGGGNVIDVGIVPTACVSYLVTKLNADFGVVISASHNPPNYNGIKILNKYGTKISEQEELFIEQNLDILTIEEKNIGKLFTKKHYKKYYSDFLVRCGFANLSGLKIVLDCCYGASSKIADKVFKKLGAEVIALHNKKNGKKINVNCGATNVEKLSREVVKHKADFGLAFDGDADRLIAVDETGQKISGDKIIFIIATYFKKIFALKNDIVVGTVLTNLAIEEQLKKLNIKFLRADVGDKNVSLLMQQCDSILGGEDAGHIILKDFLPTGDGILSGVVLASICKKMATKLSKLADIKLYPQISINYKTRQKDKIINDLKLKNEIERLKKEFFDVRILVRKSGTEDLLRIMCESKDEKRATFVAEKIEKIITKIDMD